ncbi:MAG: hypothetical protein V4754_07400 [Pseudomonadota bacterium]
MTSINALVGAGFSIASVYSTHGATLALYGASRSVPVALAALLVARGGSAPRMLLLCYLTAAIQFGDALIGWHSGDPGKTIGPLLLALATLGVALLLRRAAPPHAPQRHAQGGAHGEKRV